MTKKQTIATWYTPEEKTPPDGNIVVATVSGKGKNITYDHTFVLMEWYEDGEGWAMTNDNLDSFTVHAWCDLEPYGGD